MMSSDNQTVTQAQEWLASRIDDGAQCPCCDQRVQLYQRRIDSAMAFILVQMALYFVQPGAARTDHWLHIPRFLERFKGRPDTRGGDYAKMRFWGLITAKPEIRDDGSPRAGFWRITDFGHEFARGVLSAPRFAYTYNNHVVRFSVERTDIYRALGEKFDYAELVGMVECPS